MTAPTPLELARLAAKAREWAADFKAETWQELYVGDEWEEIEDGADCDDANRIADLLGAYPLPAAEGSEEEEILRFPEPQVLGTVDAEHGETYDRPTFAIHSGPGESTAPAAEGEREEAAAELLESARDFSTAIDNGIDDRDDVKIRFITLSDAEQRCRRAAALLRAPEPQGEDELCPT